MRNSFMLAGLSVGFFLAVACTQEAESSNGAHAQSLAAQEDEADPAPPPPRKPPKEAFEACEGKAEGVSCTVTIDDRTKEGTCRNGPDDGLACAPNDRPPPPPAPRPPKEAFEACAGKTAETSCTVTIGDQTKEGTCRGPDEALACAPNDRPPPPPAPRPPKEAFEACAGKTAGTSCTVTIDERTEVGTCRGPDEALACAPNDRPPPPHP